MRERWVTTHVAQKKYLAIDGRTTRHAGYVVSLCIRTWVEVFGWMKTVGGWRRTCYRGRDRTRTPVACSPLQGSGTDRRGPSAQPLEGLPGAPVSAPRRRSSPYPGTPYHHTC